MKRQELKLSDFQEWLSENNEVRYAYKNGVELKCTLSGGYSIYKNKKLVWQGMQPFAAIEKFNDLI